MNITELGLNPNFYSIQKYCLAKESFQADMYCDQGVRTRKSGKQKTELKYSVKDSNEGKQLRIILKMRLERLGYLTSTFQYLSEASCRQH